MVAPSVEVPSVGGNLNGSSVSESDLLSLEGRCSDVKPTESATVSLDSDTRASFAPSNPSPSLTFESLDSEG